MPPNESHDEFLELCAIATTGSLSAEEEKRLKEHLSQCPVCREKLAQYDAVIAREVPKLAPEPPFNSKEAEPASWFLEQAEAKLFARLNADDATPGQPMRSEPDRARNTAPLTDSLWRHMWWQYAAGLLSIVTLGLAAYGIGTRHGAEVAKLAPAVPPARTASEAQALQHSAGNQVSVNEEREQRDLSELRVQLEASAAEIARLKLQQTQTEKKLSDKDVDQNGLAQDKAELAHQLTLAQTNLDIVQRKLDAANAAHAQDAANLVALQGKVTQLTDTLHGRDQELARKRELLDHDRDIRELMGSRDVYMAEVYDVDKTGDTRKPFGRVFYTKEKSLIFYAYDLDQQPGIKSASTFQAWGRRGPDREEAINLGIMFEDNSSKKRWVLKSNNPKTLAEIDAVFVTVEPNGGSQHPSGKPLLFAYLKVEPNHP